MKSEAMHIALIGGGPSALFMYKRLVESNANIRVTIFERSCRLGSGMPYSQCGASVEHVTNVSSNEIPELPQSPQEWMEQQAEEEDRIIAARYSSYKVLPRKLFGSYLEAQFKILIATGIGQGIGTNVLLHTAVVDIIHEGNTVCVLTSDGRAYQFDKAVICTGHCFPQGLDEASTGYYHSPYPPNKLSLVLNNHVALRGASLTAVDAIKTLARANGEFVTKHNGSLTYRLHTQSSNFKMVLHCRSGMLPAVRFHLEDSRLKNLSLLTDAEIEQHIRDNGGFLSLDYIFEKDFKAPLKASDPEFYERIQNYSMEEFVHSMLELRENIDPFVLLNAEFNEAEKSIRRKESIYWKEMLGVLSFALNYPAKYFSAEDMLRYKATLHPLISLVIAYIPHSSCRELLALHKAGCLELINVGKDSNIERAPGSGVIYRYKNALGGEVRKSYPTYVDCTGQPQFDFNDFPFRSLMASGTVSRAMLLFRDLRHAEAYRQQHPDEVVLTADGNYCLKVAGIAVSDHFQIVEASGEANENIYMMAVPYMGGYNPDYSGLDFAEEASKRISDKMINGLQLAASVATSPRAAMEAETL